MFVRDLPIKDGVVGLPVGSNALPTLVKVDIFVCRNKNEVERLRPIRGGDHRRTTEVVYHVSE